MNHAVCNVNIYIGVTSVTIHREDRDRVEIIGEGVDATRVTERLREKTNKYAKLVSVAKVEGV